MKAPRVQPYWTGDSVKQSAVDYAKARPKFGRAEIRVLKQDGSVESVIGIGSARWVARSVESRARAS